MIPLDLSPETLEAMRVRLDRHLYGKAKSLSPNAAKAAELAGQDSDASLNAGDGNMVDAGQTTGPANPALSPQPPAIVAWDLTLRCPRCNSNVEGSVRKYVCINQRCAIGAAHGAAFIASRSGR